MASICSPLASDFCWRRGVCLGCFWDFFFFFFFLYSCGDMCCFSVLVGGFDKAWFCELLWPDILNLLLQVLFRFFLFWWIFLIKQIQVTGIPKE